jgi:hypothetical protein
MRAQNLVTIITIVLLLGGFLVVHFWSTGIGLTIMFIGAAFPWVTVIYPKTIRWVGNLIDKFSKKEEK